MSPPYQWRKLSPQERHQLLKTRKSSNRPWHAPQHRAVKGTRRYHVTAACYEHAPLIGITTYRMNSFSCNLLERVHKTKSVIYAWCLLPNHYHLLIETADILNLLKELGRLHGRSSFAWNTEENRRGRRVFFRAVERVIRSDRHFWSTLNYVHHNPVHHQYVNKWTDWPWSSAHDFLASVQRAEALRIWNDYPILDYGKGWDDPDVGKTLA